MKRKKSSNSNLKVKPFRSEIEDNILKQKIIKEIKPVSDKERISIREECWGEFYAGLAYCMKYKWGRTIKKKYRMKNLIEDLQQAILKLEHPSPEQLLAEEEFREQTGMTFKRLE